MWIKLALAAGALGIAAAPQFFPAVRAAPEPLPVMSKPAPRTFKPVCRGDEVLDSRPDPAWVRASFAKDDCRAPGPPPALDGSAATRDQVMAAMAAAKRYAGASVAFQKCVSDFVAAKRTASAHGNAPLTPSQIIIENHRILVSQRSAETAAAQVRVAINAFNSYGSDCPD